MIWRILVTLAAMAVIGAATHANVKHAGGYASGEAPLVIAVAVLLALGMGFAVTAWREGQRLGAACLFVCLLAGEGYWLATNAERELAARDALIAPVADARAQHAAAAERLEKAQAAKLRADEAAISEAAKPGCRKNCADLLHGAKATAEAELSDARAALAALPAVRSVTPLADRIGIASWAWDLILAGLRSMAVLGGSIAVALAIHPRPRARTVEAAPTVTAAPAMVVQAEPAQEADAPRAPAALIAPINGREHVATFVRSSLKPDPAGVASLRDLQARYLEWCRARTIEPLPPRELGTHLREIVEAIGLECEAKERDMFLRGASLAA